ncbi:GspE/PulE/PilB domain-containing protein [Geomonas ferrireducens]|uniref:GspE/PulE/PilB domain-containing protein n=1 Tax=Geomonas ferrireducens TaxID=2570227 RepID=UPI0010A7EA47|nr:general secretion pathway protein GspE [Geomonas ferrireducens]
MSAKLGEMLLKVGALTKGQLEQVLKAQMIYGGRIGTNLVEMGLVSEEELAHVLSEQSGAPCVEPFELGEIPKGVLQLVPVELVRKYRVMPLALDGKRLSLAMADPHDFDAVEEIGFVTGYVVKPRICTELRLNAALERYYRIARPTRFIKVEGGMRSSFEAGAASAASTPLTVGTHWVSMAEEKAPAEQFTVKDVAEMLAAAATEMEVVQALVSYMGGEFDRGGFLRLKSGKVSGVQAVADGEAVEGFVRFEADLEQLPQMARMVEEKGLVMCELAKGDADGLLVRSLGGTLPASALLLPVSMGGHVVAAICASDGKGRLGGGAFELQRVGVMAELSLEMLSLRRKIKSS